MGTVCWLQLIKMGFCYSTFFFFFLMSFGLTAGQKTLPDGSGSIHNMQCEAHENNLISVNMDVPLIEECRELCCQESTCTHFTYFGNFGVPFRNTCFLYSSCMHLDICQECETEERNCSRSCGKSFAGQMGASNTLAFLTDIYTENDCQLECRKVNECKVYTFYTENSSFLPNMCVLQTSLLGPYEDCDGCQTGLQYCNQCKFRLTETFRNSEALEHHLFTSNGRIYLDPLTLMFPENCQMRMLLIGGGGRGYYMGSGGSGFVIEKSFQANSSYYKIVVGTYDHDSSVTDGDTGVNLLLAGKGQTGTQSYGGDGYSGGGAPGYPGGSNGLGGGGDNGGHGSGFDLNNFVNFALGPGAGGVPYNSAGGGGAGGVVINGEGQQQSEYNGEGYGAGGGYNYRAGNQGAVIVEIYASK